MQPQQPQYRPQPHQSAGPTHPTHPNENYTAPEFEHNNPQPADPQHDYSFIMEPATPFPKQSFKLGAAPLVGKLVVGLGIVFVLLILFVVIRGITGGSSAKFNTLALISVLQDQQELTHLTNGVWQKPAGIGGETINSAITINLSITDSQNKLLAYLTQNKQKVNAKVLNLKLSSSIDAQMSSALANGTFDQTYQTVIQNELTVYAQDLKSAYAGDKGAKGRALLNGDYNAAQLLLQQLSSPAS